MLLFSKDFTNELTREICKASNELIICSAYIKENAIKNLLKNVSSDVSVSVIARWEKRDLITGASDLEVYDWCKSRGYRFGVNRSLHAKLYMIDQNLIFLGSSNLTHRGLGISGLGNVEIGTCIVPEDADLKRVFEFINNDISWVDEELFDLISSEVSEVELADNVFDDHAWSEDILSRLNGDVEFLQLSELFLGSPENLIKKDFHDQNTVNDLELLNLAKNDLSAKNIKNSFLKTRIYYWLVSRIGYDNEVSFGWLTNELHGALLDDIMPYRKDVKKYMVTLFMWFKFIPEIFEIKKYSHSETVIIKKDQNL